jgi:membrane-bound lytic murein transglycosylase F
MVGINGSTFATLLVALVLYLPGLQADARDLSDVRKSGVLKIVSHHRNPLRGRSPAALERNRSNEFDLAQKFAEKLKLKIEWIEAENLTETLESLQDEDADIALGGLPAEGQLSRGLLFSRPLRFGREILIASGSEGFFTRRSPPASAPDKAQEFSPSVIKGKTILVRPLTSSHEYLLRLLRPEYKTTLKVLSEDETEFEMLDRLKAGEADFAAIDEESFIRTAQTFKSEEKPAEFRQVMLIEDRSPIEWALPLGATRLKSAVDAFLQERALTAYKDENILGDFKDIKKRGVLRVLTRNSSTTYFIYRGAQLGFEYELVSKMAKDLGLRLEIVIPPDRESLFTYLDEGKGDLIAAGLTITAERKEKLLFSTPYNEVSELLVVPSTNTDTTSLGALSGDKIAVRRSSSYFTTLARLQELHGFDIEEVPENRETEEILYALGQGEYEATVADSNIVDVELTYNSRIRSVQPIGDPVKIGWAMRKGQKRLKSAVDRWIRQNYRGLFYNMILTKYFKNAKQMRIAASEERSDLDGALSPYDDLIRKYAKKYEFDWRLITAQMYQESQFNPNAKSWVGALGLMQVMPQTAKELKIPNVTRPEDGIHAGIKLLARYSAVFNSPDIKEKDRLRFALASYNCGLGHVLDGRALAREKKMDPNKWFGNVEKLMPLLSTPAYARRARHGYCRCDEPVKYVSEIQTRYEAYSKLVAPEKD